MRTVYKYTCLKCGGEAKTIQKSNAKKFCSRKCHYEYGQKEWRKATIKTCTFCSKEYKPDRLARKFCSNECKAQFQTGKESKLKGVKRPEQERAAVRKCKVCDNEFRATKDFKDTKQSFCSKECWSIRGVLTEKQCRGCDAIVPASKVFCTKSCANKYMVGENAPAYIDGKAGERNAFRKENNQLQKWRLLVFKRDNFTCQHCGVNQELHAHHVKPFAAYPDLRLDVNNGLTLCIDCHGKVHGRSFRKTGGNFCLDCNKKVKVKNTRCRPCSSKHSWKVRKQNTCRITTDPTP